MAPNIKIVSPNLSYDGPAKTVAVVQAEDISKLAERLAQSILKETYELIDTVEAIPALIQNLIDQPTIPPSIYIDLEGIHVAPQNKSYLVDIHVLGSKAFDTSNNLDHTLRSLLQSDSIPKVFFDVRNDSDALFSHFQISLAGIVDLQVMEYATRTFRKGFVSGLSKCIERDLYLSNRQQAECQRVKETGLKLFAPKRGRTYEVFNERPLSDAIGLYFVQDVKWLPKLCQKYLPKVSKSMSTKIARATLERVKESQSPLYIGHGKQKAIGLW